MTITANVILIALGFITLWIVTSVIWIRHKKYENEYIESTVPVEKQQTPSTVSIPDNKQYDVLNDLNEEELALIIQKHNKKYNPHQIHALWREIQTLCNGQMVIYGNGNHAKIVYEVS